jgi:hypothetical protein
MTWREVYSVNFKKSVTLLWHIPSQLTEAQMLKRVVEFSVSIQGINEGFQLMEELSELATVK